MNSLDTEFHRRFREKIKAVIETETESLLMGFLDLPEYKRVCGRIKAFQDALEMCAEIENDINEGK